jgi:catechol 2,3-dioxygenase-like lactoylglutathione lyase family enzyme
MGKMMFSHIMLGANDLEVSRGFYDAALGALGVKAGSFSHDKYFYRGPGGVFAITKPIDGKDATHANGGTIGFLAETQEQVHAFHAAGIANGGTTCEDPPGTREGAFGALNLAYLRDPTGNKICALHRPPKPAQ